MDGMIVYGMIVLTVLPILFGALLGLLRGSRRALLRLVLILISLALAVALFGLITKTLMNMEMQTDEGSMTMQEYMKQSITAELPEYMADFAIPLVQSILQIFVFLMLFFVIWFLTWAIAYPLCKLFVKKGQRPHRLIGLAIGAVQGVIVAVCVGVVFTGLMVQTNNVLTAVDNLNEIAASTETEAVDADYESPAEDETGSDFDFSGMIGKYAESGLAKMYDKIGSKPFAMLSRVKVDDETTITLPGQVEAVNGLVDMAKELIKLKDIDYNNMLTVKDNITMLETIFKNLDVINDNLSDEARTTVNKLMTAAGEQLGFGDLKSLNLASINFQQEAEIFARLYEYNNKTDITMDDAKDIIHDLAQSEFLLDVLQEQGVDFSSQLKDSEHLDAISGIIDGLEGDESIKQENIDTLRDIFGLNRKSDSGQPEQGEQGEQDQGQSEQGELE